MERRPKLIRLKEVEPPDVLPVEDNWDYEMKWDGWRCMADNEQLFSRKGMDITSRFQVVADEMPAAMSGHDTVTDGEIIVIREGQHNLETLQTYHELGGRALYCVFDLMWLDGESLVNEPLSERRARLESIFVPQRHVELPPAFDDQQDAIDHAVANKYEGIVAKRTDSRYRQRGETRNSDWQKLKFETYERKLIKQRQRRLK